jgi:hypothetical protein
MKKNNRKLTDMKKICHKSFFDIHLTSRLPVKIRQQASIQSFTGDLCQDIVRHFECSC